MTSPQQILANTQNGRLGAGCKTEEGKAASARNATRHGLTSKTVVLAGEDQAEFDELLEGYALQYSPANPEQRFLIQQLAESEWRLRRARGLETTFFNQHSDEEILNNREVADSLARLTRYETAIERSYYKALREVQKQMKVREADELALLDAYLNAPPPIAKRSEITVDGFRMSSDQTTVLASATTQITKRSETNDRTAAPNSPPITKRSE
jgi:hypothetical protein